MKKTISAFLAVLVLFCCLAPVAAQTQAREDAIRIRIHSDVAGCTEEDVDKLIELLSPQLAFYENGRNGPVSIANAAGGGEYAHLDRGREYAITYTLVAAEGYSLPDELPEGYVQIECGKGARVASVRVGDMYNGGGAPRIRVLSIVAVVVVDGNAFQRFVGWLRDLILKIRSWSLY